MACPLQIQGHQRAAEHSSDKIYGVCPEIAEVRLQVSRATGDVDIELLF